jgi:hypothetical protein
MAIKRQGRFYSQQRLSVPAIRDIESAVSADFDSVLRDMVAGTTTAYLLKGFKVNIGVSTFSQSADNLTVNTSNAAILHTLATESGTLLKITGSSAESLNSSNIRVSGAFIAGSTNYISIDFVRKADTSTDTVYFYDKNSNTEFSKLLPVTTLLDYKIVINTTGFTGKVPVAIITTNSGNIPTQITDTRNMFFRLGTGGLTPDQFYDFPWTSRTEPGVVTTSSGTDPFTGADKELSTFKQWMNAVMTSLKEIKGTPYWFSLSGGSSSGSLSLATVNDDANLSVLTGSGTLNHNLSVTGELISNDQITIRNVVTDAAVTIASFTATMNDGEVAFLPLVRFADISGNVTIAPSGVLPGALAGQNALVIQAGSVGQFVSLTNGNPYGDWIKSKNDNARYFRQISNFYDAAGSLTNSTNASYLLLDSAYSIAGSTTGSQQIHYNKGFYGPSDIEVSTVTDILDNYDVEDVYWLAKRVGSDIYVKGMGRFVNGEVRPVSENTSNNVLNYIGSSNESATYPAYATSVTGAILSPAQYNYGGTSTDNLTIRTSVLTSAASNQAQNKNIVLVGGGTVANAAGVITWTDVARLIMHGPGSGTENYISPGSFSLIGTDTAAYVQIDRNSSVTISVSVTASASVPLAENIFVIARRLSAESDVWLGVGGQAYLLSDNSSSDSGFTPTSLNSSGYGNIQKWRQELQTGVPFDLVETPYSVTATLLFKNGLLQTYGTDYILTGSGGNRIDQTSYDATAEYVACYAVGNNVPYVYVQSYTTISVTATAISFSPSPNASDTAGVLVFVNGLQRKIPEDCYASPDGLVFTFSLLPSDVVSFFYRGVNNNEMARQKSVNQTVTSGRTIYTYDCDINHDKSTLLSIDGVVQFPVTNTYGLTSSEITVNDYRMINPGVFEVNSSSLTTGSQIYVWSI